MVVCHPLLSLVAGHYLSLYGRWHDGDRHRDLYVWWQLWTPSHRNTRRDGRGLPPSTRRWRMDKFVRWSIILPWRNNIVGVMSIHQQNTRLRKETLSGALPATWYGEDETSWPMQGKVNFILDNLIAAGECEPMLVVMDKGTAAFLSSPRKEKI